MVKASIEEEQVGKATVIRLQGTFVTDEDAALIGECLSRCARADVRCLVINWSGVEHMNSMSIGAIVSGEMAISKQGGHYRNCAFSKRMTTLVSMLKMIYEWNYFETEAQAISTCS